MFSRSSSILKVSLFVILLAINAQSHPNKTETLSQPNGNLIGDLFGNMATTFTGAFDGLSGGDKNSSDAQKSPAREANSVVKGFIGETSKIFSV